MSSTLCPEYCKCKKKPSVTTASLLPARELGHAFSTKQEEHSLASEITITKTKHCGNTALILLADLMLRIIL